MTYQAPFTGNPIFPDILRVVEAGEDFGTKIVITVPFSKGDVICNIQQATPCEKSWRTLQIGQSSHVSLNSELVYMNHSCDPSVRIKDLTVIALKDLGVGDEITFFYPSTEWEIAQPFECWCSSKNCLKKIRGAKYLDKTELKKYVFEKHIVDLSAAHQ